MGAHEPLQLLQRHRVTVDEYYRMAEAGVLAPDARTELIDGEVIDVASMNSRHASVVTTLMRRLMEAAHRRAVVTCQTPLRLSDHSEPEPDLMLLKPCADDYAQAHPGPADVLLLVEVSDANARYDREIKLPLYARHGVAEVWLVDLDAGLVRFHRRPDHDGDGSWLETSATRTPGMTPLPGLDGVTIDLAGILR